MKANLQQLWWCWRETLRPASPLRKCCCNHQFYHLQIFHCSGGSMVDPRYWWHPWDFEGHKGAAGNLDPGVKTFPNVCTWRSNFTGENEHQMGFGRTSGPSDQQHLGPSKLWEKNSVWLKMGHSEFQQIINILPISSKTTFFDTPHTFPRIGWRENLQDSHTYCEPTLYNLPVN